jgi:hypothetical protein
MRYEEFEQKSDTLMTQFIAWRFSGAVVGVVIVLAIIGLSWMVM